MDGTERKNVKKGQKVAIVLKEDQRSAELTEGVVSDLLTNSSFHPHGIKVRLESGEVGRVKKILDLDPDLTRLNSSFLPGYVGMRK